MSKTESCSAARPEGLLIIIIALIKDISITIYSCHPRPPHCPLLVREIRLQHYAHFLFYPRLHFDLTVNLCIRCCSESESEYKRNIAWIQGTVDNDSFFTTKDKQAYSKQLRGVRLGQKLSVGGGNNFAIYQLTGYGYGLRFRSSNLIMKVLKDVNNAAIGEAKALRAVGDFVASGTVKALDSRPAIIMKKKPGLPLHETNLYKNAREQQRETMRSKTFQLMCDKIVTVATKKYVLHNDNHPANVLVTMNNATKSVQSVELVDYGAPSTYFISKSVTADEYLWDHGFPYVAPAPPVPKKTP
ncbi:hypothetical protein J3R30DRAFT_851527 [Lentinula aciculospora]|uniref:Protein kinase domain-containing protein n=1 Tax=Lentinula aciculospora TaxID=153920 RepID=A0A9W9DVF0_9AGAR|nr:hypothetical protein J3R30DRAFT_851527 [Lentinula aciculospora]